MVNERVGAGNWDDGDELGDTWVSRNAFSYGRGGERGTARPEVLRSLLKTTDRIVQVGVGMEVDGGDGGSVLELGGGPGGRVAVVKDEWDSGWWGRDEGRLKIWVPPEGGWVRARVAEWMLRVSRDGPSHAMAALGPFAHCFAVDARRRSTRWSMGSLTSRSTMPTPGRSSARRRRPRVGARTHCAPLPPPPTHTYPKPLPVVLPAPQASHLFAPSHTPLCAELLARCGLSRSAACMPFSSRRLPAEALHPACSAAAPPRPLPQPAAHLRPLLQTPSVYSWPAGPGAKVGCSVIEAFSKEVKPRELEEVLRLEYRSKLLNPKCVLRCAMLCCVVACWPG